MSEESEPSARVIEFPAAEPPPHVQCPQCGAEWLERTVVIDAATGPVTIGLCTECETVVELP
jgi:hypothetical protein